MTPAIGKARSALTSWLTEAALPLWAINGVDAAGGLYELLDESGLPIVTPRFCFTTARQLQVFTVAKQFGWDGHSAAAHAMESLLRHFRRDGDLYAAVYDPGTGKRDDRFDLYDHAFVLFALAAVARNSDDAAGLEASALRTLAALRHGWSHATAGFEEGQPPVLPLRANPHMHLLEAALEWMSLPSVNPGVWSELADELVDLCLSKFIDQPTGALHEFFDHDWRFAAGDIGRIVEPGHQYEWAWLLVRWSILRGRPDVLLAARRMAALAELHGVRDGLAVNELWDDLSSKDRNSLLWPQTERIKAWVAFALVADDELKRDEALALVAEAANGLLRFLSTETRGLWFREWTADGGFAPEPVPARFLYHIVCAIQELHRLA